MTDDIETLDDTKKLILWMKFFVFLVLATIVIFGFSFIWGILTNTDI